MTIEAMALKAYLYNEKELALDVIDSAINLLVKEKYFQKGSV